MRRQLSLILLYQTSAKLTTLVVLPEALRKVKAFNAVRTHPSLHKGRSLIVVCMVLDNLFFRQDDGCILAIHTTYTLGPELLRGLS